MEILAMLFLPLLTITMAALVNSWLAARPHEVRR
jgi:hypothetical protein